MCIKMGMYIDCLSTLDFWFQISATLPSSYNAIAFRNEIEIKIKKVKNLKQKKNWESFCRNRKQQTKVGF